MSGALPAGAAVACTLCAVLAGACSVAPQRCDPSDTSFGLSLLCQKEYARRQEERQAEVEAAARRAESIENERDAVADERRALAGTLDALEERARSAASRVEALRREGRASGEHLDDVEARIGRVDDELAELEAQRDELEGSRPDPELVARVETLRAEEAELESLLLELES